MQADPLLVMNDISKAFPGVRALDGVQLTVQPGSVHALVGENGAGKSTLMNILIGIHRPDSGSIYFQGNPTSFHSVNEALRSGISMIHQELCPVPHMTVAENIFLGREPTCRNTFWVDANRMVHDTRELFRRLDVTIDPRRKMRDLSMADTQMVEIAKAISYHSSLIIMDEPTSAITQNEIAQLFRIIHELKERGVSIVYISHKLDEVFSIADRVSVLRDGRHVDTVSTEDIDHTRLIEMMVGRQLDELFPKQTVSMGPVFLELRDLSREPYFRDVSMQVHSGEILGIAGLMGAGRTEIVETIFGIWPYDSGEIHVRGQRVELMSPHGAIDHGMALLTEDRKLSGLFLNHDVRANMIIAGVGRFMGRVLVDHRRVDRACQNWVRSLRIRTPSLRETVGNLSGGNQQKVLIARWLLTEPDILILDEPTRGVDVGAKAEIHRWMTELARKGKAIVMISSELPEILGMSDRILVVHDGNVTGLLSRAEATQEEIIRRSMGLRA